MILVRNPDQKKSDLDLVIDRVLVQIPLHEEWSKEYDALTTQLAKLYKLRSEMKTAGRVSPDTWALIAANLTGILLVVGYEHAHVITTKALGFVGKLR